MSFKKNDLAEITITGLTAEGSGVGRADGFAVFVPAAAVGDKLLVKLVKVAKNYGFGRIEKILEPSPDRIEADCGVYSRCGGCCYRHISYEAELAGKENRVRDAVERIAGLKDAVIRPILGADSPDRYRNKAQYPVGRDASGKPVLGFYAPHSHRIAACTGCLLQPAEFQIAAEVFLEWLESSGEDIYDESTGKGRVRHLYLRKALATGEVMVCVVVNGNGLHGEDELAKRLRAQVPGLKSFLINSNREDTNVVLGKKCRTVWGGGAITDVLCGLKFRISPLSFYQVNRSQAERLYGLAKQYADLTGKELLLDLYCGAGTIGLSMADQARRVIGVEIIPQAVEDAKQNAADNGITNAEFHCMDAAKAADMLKERGEKPDVVVLDPPRKGCGADLIQTVASLSPHRVVYVSCDPATLARDLKLFGELGYRVCELAPVDMFPRTPHVETVVKMTR